MTPEFDILYTNKTLQNMFYSSKPKQFFEKFSQTKILFREDISIDYIT